MLRIGTEKKASEVVALEKGLGVVCINRPGFFSPSQLRSLSQKSSICGVGKSYPQWLSLFLSLSLSSRVAETEKS